MSDAFDIFLANVSQAQFGWPDSLRFTYDTTRRLLVDGVKGDLVECGVAAGVHPAMMARACQDAGKTRSIRLFDSFQGVPHGGPNDAEWNAHYGDGSGRLEPTGVAACSLADVQANLARWGCDGDLFTFYVGWFQSVVPPVASAWAKAKDEGRAEGIAFLRLDGDLYASTKVCLEHLYPLVVSGGVCVLDDYNLDGCRQAFRDYFASLAPDWEMVEGKPAGFLVPTVTPITASGDVWWAKP